MVIYPCTFLFVLPQKEKIPKEKSQALNLRGYSEHVFANPPLRRGHAALGDRPSGLRDAARHVST